MTMSLSEAIQAIRCEFHGAGSVLGSQHALGRTALIM